MSLGRNEADGQSTSAPTPLRVVHFHTSFGELTENWISHQIASLGEYVVGMYSLREASEGRCPQGNHRCFQRDVGTVGRFLNRATGRLLHRYPQYLFWLVRDRANLVHAHFGASGCYMWPFTHLLGISLVTSFYGCDAYALPYAVDARWRDSYRQLFARGQAFLAEGTAMRNQLTVLGCPPEKVFVHHVGVNVSAYGFHARHPDGCARLLVCGRFVEKKGIPYAVEAVYHVRRTTGRKVHLTIVGDSDRQGAMTPAKQAVVGAIERFDLGHCTSLTGFVPPDRLSRIIQDHHILLVPSVHAADGDAEGGFPVVVTEALATGMPVVAFDHCDIGEIVRDGECGFLAPEGDVTALAEKLRHLIAHPEVWPQMGRAGRAHVEANYNLQRLSGQLVQIYEAVGRCG